MLKVCEAAFDGRPWTDHPPALVGGEVLQEEEYLDPHKAGFLAEEETPVFQEGNEDPTGKVAESAKEYLEWCVAHPVFEVKSCAKAVRLGTELVKSAGNWKKAVHAYRKVWTECETI